MDEEGSSYVQLMLAASLVIAAFLVILTCTWKLVRLLAMYKMESQIEVGTYRILIEEDLFVFKDLFRDRRNTSPDFGFLKSLWGGLYQGPRAPWGWVMLTIDIIVQLKTSHQDLSKRGQIECSVHF